MKKPITDHLGNEYSSVKKMCEAYGINEKTFHSRITRNGYSLEEALGAIPRLNSWTNEIIVDDKLTICKKEMLHDKTYFECILNGRKVILHRENILDHYRHHIFNQETIEK